MKFTLIVSMCDASHYVPLARAAEESGWSSVCVPDSIFYPEQSKSRYPYTPDGDRSFLDDAPFIEPFVAIPAMAAVTSRIHFYPYVLKLPIRHPLLVAKTVASAAVMSGDRVGLGVGLSPWLEDFTFLGQDWDSRGPRMDEMIEIIRKVLTGGYVEHHGDHYSFDRLKLCPVPSRPVPIYIGGHSERALRRAARVGDGWVSAGSDLSTLQGFVGKLARYREEAGRGDAPFEVQALVPELTTADDFRRLGDAGATDAVVGPWGIYEFDPLTIEGKQDAVRRFADEVIAKL